MRKRLVASALPNEEILWCQSPTPRTDFTDSRVRYDTLAWLASSRPAPWILLFLEAWMVTGVSRQKDSCPALSHAVEVLGKAGCYITSLYCQPRTLQGPISDNSNPGQRLGSILFSRAANASTATTAKITDGTLDAGCGMLCLVPGACAEIMAVTSIVDPSGQLGVKGATFS